MILRTDRDHGKPRVVIGTDALPSLLRFCEEDQRRRLFLVADENTYTALGEKVDTALRGQGCDVKSVVFTGDEVAADARHILRVMLAYDRADRTFLAIGSGTITDITRFVSHRTRNPFISLPTAPSVDGFTSMGAPLIVDGIKTSAPAHAPIAVFADLDVLCAAPHPMIAAGFGDMLGKYTSVADWRLGHLLWDQPYDDAIARRSLDAVRRCVDKVREIGEASPGGVQSLMEGLIESGFCMLDFGSSLPASGTEHHYSHYWEMRLMQDGRPAILHGAKVGVATVLVAGLYEKVRALSQKEVSDILEASSLPSREKEVGRIRSAYGLLADDVIATQASFLDMSDSDYNRLKRKILDRWPEILRIAHTVPSAERIADLLQAVEGATDAHALGLTDSDLALATSSGHYLREQFTIRRLMGVLF